MPVDTGMHFQRISTALSPIPKRPFYSFNSMLFCTKGRLQKYNPSAFAIIGSGFRFYSDINLTPLGATKPLLAN
ncbi:hypothetical protein PROFUN_08769 [Planoprotostelium fungivorum]|uniref:Uncharacterized protein n=1 Tax=Planoprotostelium fungivorum TaxID=1890364 RepID=A0A2P6MVP3_9EUKA|nr:hypothetical protein PROFUN_08769 [Planoprotostelium fungivorum]